MTLLPKQETFHFDFDLPVLAEDFFVSESNHAAATLLQQWPNWPSYGVYLYGQKGSGKTHLARVWQQQSGAQWLTRIEKQISAITTPVVLEHCEGIKAEQALFHLLNAVREAGKHILITGAVPPSELPFTLPDVRSRLLALTSVSLSTPDDMLMRAVLCKYFSDRQLRISEEVVNYILARIDRSFPAISALVEKLDKAAIREQRALTIPLVKKVWEA